MTPTVHGEPLAVWDCRDDSTGWQQAVEWAQAHINDANVTFRVEFYLVDAPFAVLYRYARDDQGRIRSDPATGAAMIAAEPVLQVLDEMPPRELLCA